MLTPESVVLAVLAGCLALPLLLRFVLAPVRMRARSRQAAAPVFTPDDEDRLPPAARDAAADLRDLGFDDRGTWRKEEPALGTSHVAVLEHPRTRDVAKVVVVTTGTRQTVTLMLQTRFADGTEAVTSNSPVVAGFPLVPGVTAAWLPELREAAPLVRLHARLRDALGGTRERLAIGPDVAAFLRDGATRVVAHWVAAGYYAPAASPGLVRPTWKGAALITWRLCWPIKPLFRASRRRATRRLLDRLGIALDR